MAPAAIEAVEPAGPFQLPPVQVEAGPFRENALMPMEPLERARLPMVAVPVPTSVPPLTVRFERLAVPAVMESVPPLNPKVPAPLSAVPLARVDVPPPKLSVAPEATAKVAAPPVAPPPLRERVPAETRTLPSLLKGVLKATLPAPVLV